MLAPSAVEGFDAALAETLACPELCRAALVNSAATAVPGDSLEASPSKAAPFPARVPAWLPVPNVVAAPVEIEPPVEEPEGEAIDIVDAAVPGPKEDGDTSVAPVIVVPIVTMPAVVAPVESALPKTGDRTSEAGSLESADPTSDFRPPASVLAMTPAPQPQGASPRTVESSSPPVAAVATAPIEIAPAAASPARISYQVPAAAMAIDTPDAAPRAPQAGLPQAVPPQAVPPQAVPSQAVPSQAAPAPAPRRIAPVLPQAPSAVPAEQPSAPPVIQDVVPVVDTFATVVPLEKSPGAAAPQQASVSRAEPPVTAADTRPSADDAPSQGRERPSPEFMRFVAALSQVTPKTEDAGRGTTPVFSVPAASVPATATPPIAPAAPAATVPVPSDTAPDAENVGRLVQAMRVQARTGAWEATVRLKPEHFGEVTIAMRIEGNSVSTVVHAEAAGVRQWLESQEQAVRSGMAEHGLSLDRFVVHRDGQQQRREPQQQEPRRRQQPPRAPQDGPHFEIVV